MENSTVTRSRPTFLVVDDDAMVRKLVAHGLAALEPESVIEVEDGLQAQKVLSERQIDVVITDVLMPNMDGRALMQWAKTNCPEPLWIVLSGLDTFDAAIDALHLGAFDYLAKPPEVQRVRVAVRNALDKIEMRRDRARLRGEIERSNGQLATKVEQLESVCHMLEDQAAVINDDIARAEVIQRALLPKHPPKVRGWCVESLYRPGNIMGGDFYDIIPLRDRYVGIVVADAAGHGVAAAMVSVLFKLRLALWDDQNSLPLMPKDVLRVLNGHLCEDLSAPGTFITAVYALLDHRTGHVRIASAGHPSSIWTSPGGQSKLLTRTGPALGLEAQARYTETSLDMEMGDRLLLYTDGVLEGGTASPTHDDLTAAMLQSELDRGELLRDAYERATRDVARDRDDITMILLERGEGVSRFDDRAAAPPPRETVLAPELPPRLLAGVAKGRAYMSIAGKATWMRSSMFYEAATQLMQRRKDLTIDLDACEYLDSTFLGTLYEIVSANLGAVRLQRVPTHIRALFDELSMECVLSCASLMAEPLPEQMEPLKRTDDDANQQGRRVLKAHEVLASLSEDNREQFQGVVESLRADLAIDVQSE